MVYLKSTLSLRTVFLFVRVTHSIDQQNLLVLGLMILPLVPIKKKLMTIGIIETIISCKCIVILGSKNWKFGNFCNLFPFSLHIQKIFYKVIFSHFLPILDEKIFPLFFLDPPLSSIIFLRRQWDNAFLHSYVVWIMKRKICISVAELDSKSAQLRWLHKNTCTFNRLYWKKFILDIDKL